MCFLAITFCAQDAGDSFNHAPNTAQARRAAESILSTLHQEPSIDIWSGAGISGGVKEGRITLENVSFACPSRPLDLILSELNFTIQLCGSDGIAFSGGQNKRIVIA